MTDTGPPAGPAATGKCAAGASGMPWPSAGSIHRGLVLAIAFAWFSIPFGELQKIALGGLTMVKLVLPAVFIALVAIRSTRLILHPHLGLIVAFVLTTTPSFLSSDVYPGIALNLLGYIVLFVVFRNALESVDDVRRIFLGYVTGLAIVSLLATAALVSGLDIGVAMGRPLVEVWYGSPVMLGTENNPNAFATLLVPGAPIALFHCHTSCSGWRKLIFGTCFLVFVFLLMLTYSRSGIAGAAIASAIVIYYGNRRSLRAGVLAAAILGALFVISIAIFGKLAYQGGGSEGLSVYSNKEQSQGFRAQIAEQYLPLIAEHPLLGIGYGNLPPLMERRAGLRNNSHNILAGVAIEFGLPAALLFATLILVSLRAVARGMKVADTHADVVTGGCIFAVMVGLAVHGMFHEIYVNLMLWSFIGLGGVYPILIRNAGRRRDVVT